MSNLSQAEKRRGAQARTLSLLGAKLVKLPKHADSRGCLIALDRDQSLPFDVRRVYCIYQTRGKTVRGEHAMSAHCAMVVLQGAVDVDLDNGQAQASVRLSRTDQALCIHAGVWLRVRDFANGAILLVAASHLYADVMYFDRPNPDLLKPIPQARWR
jgi:dTDP-4-dehydrorhamnose 3,5-epimerase-like enzyme